MAKFNIEEIYGERIVQIDKEIKAAIRNRQWTLKKMLEAEKVKINLLIGKSNPKG